MKKPLKLMLVLAVVANIFIACGDNAPETKTFPRIVLVEEFTGVTCGACPLGARTIEAAVKDLEDRVVVVCHHTGFADDQFTIADSRPLTYYYNGSDFAPACMTDRYMVIEDNKNASGTKPSPVFLPYEPTNGISKELILKEINRPAYVSVNLTTNYNASTRKLDIDVSGEFLKEYPFAKLNVYLVQNGIVDVQSDTEMQDVNPNYTHNHVIRHSFTGAWGDIIPFTVGKYSKSYSWVIPDVIAGVLGTDVPAVPKDMYVVAFVADDVKNNKTEINIENGQIHNAAFKYITK